MLHPGVAIAHGVKQAESTVQADAWQAQAELNIRLVSTRYCAVVRQVYAKRVRAVDSILDLTITIEVQFKICTCAFKII